MTLHSIFPSGRALTVFCGLALTAGSLFIRPARGDEWDKRTILTVQNQPIQIRDTVLQPGQYVLKLYDSQSDRHVVQIFDRYQTHIINTILAIPAERMNATGRTTFTFWETPPGTAKAMRDWYFPGDLTGSEFPYPKHLEQIAMAEPAPVVTNTETTTSSETTANNNESTQTEAPAQTEPMTPAPAEQPNEIAQNTAPPQTTPAPETTPAPQEQPQQLPHTGSPYPLIGLS